LWVWVGKVLLLVMKLRRYQAHEVCLVMLRDGSRWSIVIAGGRRQVKALADHIVHYAPWMIEYAPLVGGLSQYKIVSARTQVYFWVPSSFTLKWSTPTFTNPIQLENNNKGNSFNDL
jgi:hypothetical protein